MNTLTRRELLTLEQYAALRPQIRAAFIAYKQHRQFQLSDHIRLFFENRVTIQYQLQEILRAEKIFEAEGIDEELEAYNPLVPDGRNWKATVMLEYADETERRQALATLVGIEDCFWIRVAGFDKVFGIANEDMERSTDSKTSSVHFMRFELTEAMAGALAQGAEISMGVEHPHANVTDVILPTSLANSLQRDLVPCCAPFLTELKVDYTPSH